MRLLDLRSICTNQLPFSMPTKIRKHTEEIAFKIAIRSIRHPGINLIEDVQDQYESIYKTIIRH